MGAHRRPKPSPHGVKGAEGTIGTPGAPIDGEVLPARNLHVILVRLPTQDKVLSCITHKGSIAVFGDKLSAALLMAKHPLRTQPFQIVKVEI